MPGQLDVQRIGNPELAQEDRKEELERPDLASQIRNSNG